MGGSTHEAAGTGDVLKAAAGLFAEGKFWECHKPRVATTLILTHRFERAGSVAADVEMMGEGQNPPHQSAAANI